MKNAPRNPAEFRCVALKAMALREGAPDPDGVRAALDEVVQMLERVYVGEQAAPTPCQLLMGRMFLEEVEEHLERHKNSFFPPCVKITVPEWPKL